METLLFIAAIVGCLVIALGRATALRAAPIEGTELGEVALSFRERLQYHRGMVYCVAGLLLLGALTGVIHTGLELVLAGAALAVVNVPVRYRFTTRGIALGRVLFRRWEEFQGYRASKKGAILIGKPGNGGFRLR